MLRSFFFFLLLALSWTVKGELEYYKGENAR